MSRFCAECPAGKFLMENVKPEDRSLALNVAQGLSGAFRIAVRGTKGLNTERIEQIRQRQVKLWVEGNEEADFLQANPELAQAVYGCEEMVTVLGTCALHSTNQR